MTDYKDMWESAVQEAYVLKKENEQLKAAKKEIPTLRDQFAMAVLPGLLANPNITYMDKVKRAYDMADQMLVFRL